MAIQLKSIVSFTGLTVGVPVITAHGLNQDGRGLTPDLIALSASGFAVTADTTSVTITRSTATAPAAVNVYVESWHTIERLFGPYNPPPGVLPSGSLTPQPFIISQGEGATECYNIVTTAVSLPADINDAMLVSPALGGVVITLPAIDASNAGCTVVVANNSSSIVAFTVAGNGLNTIQGLPSIPISSAFASLTFMSDGVSNWVVI